MNKETLRMQMLAGIITESQYKEKMNEAETPQLTVSDIETLKQDPKIQSLAKKLAQKPEELEKAKAFLSKAGINVGVNESLENISQGELNKAMDFVSSLNEEEIGTGLGFLGALGGTIASFIPGVLPYVNNLLGFLPANPAGGVALVAGGFVAPYLALGAIIAAVTVANEIFGSNTTEGDPNFNPFDPKNGYKYGPKK
jgi:hypothetical protein